MRIHKDYKIVYRDGASMLVNIENGDVYEMNDVCLNIFELCSEVNNSQELCDKIFSKYVSEDCEDNYTIEDLKEFVDDLVDKGFILK